LPVLASLLARDSYLPHLFALRDDRQVFASGIWTLGILSGALLPVVRGVADRCADRAEAGQPRAVLLTGAGGVTAAARRS
jgi:hypothetical protein